MVLENIQKETEHRSKIFKNESKQYLSAASDTSDHSDTNDPVNIEDGKIYLKKYFPNWIKTVIKKKKQWHFTKADISNWLPAGPYNRKC